MRKKYLLYALFVILMGTACASLDALIEETPTVKPIVIDYPTAAPTSTIDKTVIAQPTPTTRPTETSAPTNTPFTLNSIMPTAETINGIGFNPEQVVPGGSFAFRPLFMGELDIQVDTAYVASADGNVLVVMLVDIAFYDTPAAYLDSLFFELGDEFERVNTPPPSSTSVDGKNGLVAGIKADLDGDAYDGQVVVVFLGDDEVFVGLGMGLVDAGSNYWDTGGQDIFETLLSTVRFINEGQVFGNQLACSVAADGTYGYSEDNPVQVGGGAFGGPLRERLYFNTLRGPNGEVLTYTRNGSVPYGDTILDTFTVSYSGSGAPVTIYVDEYAFSDLMAPVGFTCGGNFPMSAP